MKFIIAIIMSFFITTAYAQQDDRYFDSRKSYSITRAPSYAHKRVKTKIYAQRQHRGKVSVPRYAGENYTSDPVQWVAKPPAQAVGEVVGGRPTTGPRNRHGNLLPWCGWWLGQHLGLTDRKLWLARNWASVGAPSGRVIGSVVVWNHHVGIITDVSGARIKVLSGNDGHRVRNRWRSGSGVIAYRRI